MNLDRAAFRPWDEASHDWKVYPGKYEVEAGNSSRDIRYRDSFHNCELNRVRTR